MSAATPSQLVAAAVLLALVLVSAVAVVQARHDARRLFIQLEALTDTRDALNIDWGRLQIEQSTWASPGRIEQIATERLEMRVPDPVGVVIIAP